MKEEVGRFNNQWLIYTMKSPFEIRRPIRTFFNIYTSIRVSIFVFSAWRNSTRSVVNYTDSVDRPSIFPSFFPLFFSIINNRKFFPSFSSIFSIYPKIDREEKKEEKEKISSPPSIIHRVFSPFCSLSHAQIESSRVESSRSVTAKLISIPPFLQLYVSRIIHNRIRAFSYTSIEPSIIFPFQKGISEGGRRKS